LRISYVGPKARTVQQVTERLTSLMIDESLRDREILAQNANEFLEGQLEDARVRLVAQEKKVQDYKRQHSGELPTQSAANLQVIQNTQVQLQALDEATTRARERRSLIERQLADLQSPDPVVAASATPASPTPSQGGVPGESTAQKLEAARARLEALQMRAKPTHPDVRVLQRTIRNLEAKLEAEGEHPTETSTDGNPLSPTEVQRQKRIQELNAQREDIDRELQDKEQAERRLRAAVAAYQAKLDVQPTRESELAELTRDYSALQTNYQDLLAKREQSKMAANLERQNIDKQFRLLEPARIPERPFSPNRLQIYLAGTGAGLALGVLLVGFLEYRDSTLKCQEDVTRLFDLPVLALVPVMMSTGERRVTRKRQHFFGAAKRNSSGQLQRWGSEKH
jgi:uncharacterized protein involved in exopolysaccharide biosynthesis